MRVRPEEKRRRWEQLQKARMGERIYKTNCFDGEYYKGKESTYDSFHKRGETELHR